jgi:hypothetical protein
MTALANAGYLVMSPNHKDAICAGFLRQRPEESFQNPAAWNNSTRDLGITPSVKKSDGCYSATPSPAYFVELSDAGHFAWTDLNSDYQDLINH